MLVLVVGDIIGKPGRRAVNELLPDLRQQYGLDLVIANAENVAGGIQYIRVASAADVKVMSWQGSSIFHLLRPVTDGP